MYTESELKKHLSSGQFKNLYLIFGEEKMIVKRSVELIEKKISGGSLNDFNYHVFDDTADIGEISVCADMIPFMSEYNLIRVTDMNFDKLTSEDYESMMKIIKGLPDTTVMILAMLTLDVTSKSAKANFKKLITYADKHGICMEIAHRTGLMLERDLCKWAKAGGCSMSELTAHHLISFVGEDLNRLNTEMKKLTAYADGSEITPEMIDLLTAKTTEANVFDLFGCIMNSDINRAMHALSALFYDQVSGVSICTILSGAYLDAYRARIGAQAGRKDDEIGSDFSYGRMSWKLNKTRRQAHNVTTAALRRSVDELLRVQTRMVSETVDERTELERLVCQLVILAEDHSDD